MGNCAKFLCTPACCMSDRLRAHAPSTETAPRRLRTRLAAMLDDLPRCKLRRFCFGFLLSLPKAVQLGSGELSGCLRELSPERVQLSRPHGPRSLLGRARPPPRHACACNSGPRECVIRAPSNTSCRDVVQRMCHDVLGAQKQFLGGRVATGGGAPGGSPSSLGSRAAPPR
jgi:hypothetical protein